MQVKIHDMEKKNFRACLNLYCKNVYRLFLSQNNANFQRIVGLSFENLTQL